MTISCVIFGVVIGFVVAWFHMLTLLRDGETYSLPLLFKQRPFNPLVVVPVTVFQVITGGVPKLRPLFIWSLVIWSSVAWIAVRIFRHFIS